MAYLEITGGKPLYGEITVQGSKNAALPILAACILGNGPCLIENCPQIQDVDDTIAILTMLGCSVKKEGRTVTVNAGEMEKTAICGSEAGRIRSSILFLGALLGRMGKAEVPYPGGCAIGSRPIDLHLQALKKLGVYFDTKECGISCVSDPLEDPDACGLQKDRKIQDCRAGILAGTSHLHGGSITLDVPSVGATENSILAAVCADGETLIRHGAMEPEVEELCDFLRARGARISRDEDQNIHICGVKTLSPVRYRLRADRIVAGSYLLAAASCGGCVCVRNLPAGQLDTLFDVLRRMGAEVSTDGVVRAALPLLAVHEVRTAPYPGFPTDLQSPLMAALCTAKGISRIRETVFENRFQTAVQLKKNGSADSGERQPCPNRRNPSASRRFRERSGSARRGSACAGGADSMRAHGTWRI